MLGFGAKGVGLGLGCAERWQVWGPPKGVRIWGAPKGGRFGVRRKVLGFGAKGVGLGLGCAERWQVWGPPKGVRIEVGV